MRGDGVPFEQLDGETKWKILTRQGVTSEELVSGKPGIAHAPHCEIVKAKLLKCCTIVNPPACTCGAAAAPKKKKRNRDESSVGRQRALTGKIFEAEIAQTNEWYKFRGFAHVRRNHVPSRVIRDKDKTPRRVLTRGGADVDFTGWISIERRVVGGPPYFVPLHWNAKRGATRLPVAFDVKALNAKSNGRYKHDVELQHQLHALKDAAEHGEFAFLLVHCPAMRTGMNSTTCERVFAIPILNHWDELISGRGVQLFERQRRSDVLGPIVEDEPLLPSIEKRYDVPGWDWIQLVEYCHPGQSLRG